MAQLRIVAMVDGEPVDLAAPESRLRTLDDACRLAIELGLETGYEVFVLVGDDESAGEKGQEHRRQARGGFAA